MAKAKPEYSIVSYGIYDHWDATSKILPKIQTFTTEIPARTEIEFGFILKALRAKGKKCQFTINHPGILNNKGKPLAPFVGEEYVSSNDWQFYLGDTLWLPLDDKLGDWHMHIEIEGQIVAEKTFDIIPESALGEARFWKSRGF